MLGNQECEFLVNFFLFAAFFCVGHQSDTYVENADINYFM